MAKARTKPTNKFPALAEERVVDHRTSHPEPELPRKRPPDIPDYLLEERVIGVPVAAQIVDLSEWTLYDLIKRGRGPPTVRLCGRKIGIRIKDLKVWIESRANYSRPAKASAVIHPEA
jgi:predicted DNA-binding transcriptional regulator AlpA